jgi:hypothetical protein
MIPGSKKKDPAPSFRKDPKTKGSVDPLFDGLAPPPDEAKDEAIARLAREGKKYREIVKELGVSQSRIAEVLAKEGLLGEQRRRKEVKESLVLFDEQFLASIIELPFDFFAKRYGSFWKLGSDEKEKLTNLSNKLASKYIPLWVERFADEIAFLSTFAIIIYPRYLMTKELTGKPKEEIQTLGPEPQPVI